MYKVIAMALALCLMTVSVAFAEMKIGVVEMQRIAVESALAKDVRKKMESKYGKERTTLEKQAKDLQTKAEALKKNPTEKKQVEFIRLKREFDEKTRDFARKVEQDEIKIRQDMVSLVFTAAYKVAQRKGFNFVVDVSAGGVLYAEQSMDLTEDVLKEVDKLWKSGALNEK